jgi:protein TonB
VTASYDYCPRPAYSEKLEGTVILQVVVDEDGKPKSLAINKSSGSKVLDQAAVTHVKQRCRFHPARQGERRVESVVEFPVVFKLAAFGR